MSLDGAPKISTPEVLLWNDTATRFLKKIGDKRDENESLKKIGVDREGEESDLNLLEEKISELFPVFEKKNMTIKDVEEDLRYRIESEVTGEKDKVIFEQILAMIQVRKGPLF